MARGETAKKPGEAPRSLEQEAFLSLQRTADLIARAAEACAAARWRNA
jgi:hypothetical protein